MLPPLLLLLRRRNALHGYSLIPLSGTLGYEAMIGITWCTILLSIPFTGLEHDRAKLHCSGSITATRTPRRTVSVTRVATDRPIAGLPPRNSPTYGYSRYRNVFPACISFVLLFLFVTSKVKNCRVRGTRISLSGRVRRVVSRVFTLVSCRRRFLFFD